MNVANLKKFQEDLFKEGSKKLEDKIGKSNKNSIFIGVVTGFIISIFLLFLEIISLAFNLFNFNQIYLLIIYLFFLIGFWLSGREFAKIISK